MTVAQLIEPLELTLLTPQTSLEREVTGGCVCDLLSFVMARGDAGMAWITVQTHLNVIAVASLHEFSCVIVAEGSAVEPETLAKDVYKRQLYGCAFGCPWRGAARGALVCFAMHAIFGIHRALPLWKRSICNHGTRRSARAAGWNSTCGRWPHPQPFNRAGEGYLKCGGCLLYTSGPAACSLDGKP